MGASNGQNMGFQPGMGMTGRSGFNQNPYQPQQQHGSQMANMGPMQSNGYPKYQFYGNPQYDMQMPWMNNFNSQNGQNIGMGTMTNMGMGANSINNYNTPRPGATNPAPQMIANNLQKYTTERMAMQPGYQPQQSWINGNTEFQSAPPAVNKAVPNYAANPSPLGVDDVRARLFASTGGNVTPEATNFYRSQFMPNPSGSPYSVAASGQGDDFYAGFAAPNWK